MILKYNGSRKLFVYKNIDFSTGKAEVDNAVGEKLITDSNGTFTLWEASKLTPIVKAMPKTTPKVKIKPKTVKPRVVKAKVKK